MTDTTAPPEQAKPTVADLPYMEFLRTLDGYEELAIEQTFGRDIDSLGFGLQLRALVFVSRLRGKVEASAARREVMGMTVRQIFNEYPDLSDPADPKTDETPEPAAGDSDAAAAE
ncbi:hypothetical protein [Nocardioides sp. 503]|uniref:hypothetical protein n=1 Tax=Nocardioides sp. 503 TaxID=2508326 RepID=UPI00106F1E46|nr:hypothetical protein [Nocardioides sp. 503]